MSIQSQIDRIEQAKSDIAASIIGKGVGVPSGTQIDGMSALIDQISSGGSSLPTTIVAGNTPVLASFTGKKVTSTSATSIGASVSISRSGTYRFYVPAFASSTYSMGGSSSPSVYIYKNGSSVSNATVSTSNTSMVYFDVACSSGDTIAVYASAVSSGYITTAITVLGLFACIEWDNGF